MSIATDVKVATLEGLVKALLTRVQALEHLRVPAAPPRNNAKRRADGEHLRAAVETILASHPDYTAKHVLKALAAIDLGRPSLPSVRTVQWHLTALRNTHDVLRTTCSTM